ncbi:ABC transporter permease [Faecalimicrobium sp. JNUCC 81]
MLGKLLKYELKAYIRIFIPIYIAIIAMSFLNRLFGGSELFQMQFIMTTVLIGLFVALYVLSIIIAIQRFRKNLLGDEGYLMFTLPVKTSSIIISKYLASLIFTILSGLVALLSFMIIFNAMNISEITLAFNEIWNGLSSQPEFRSLIFIISAGLFLAYSTFILQIYLSLSVGQLPKFNKHRNIVALATFFIINVIIGNVNNSIISHMPIDFDYESGISQVSKLSANGSNYMFIISIIIIGLLFAGTVYILNKKLNLE